METGSLIVMIVAGLATLIAVPASGLFNGTMRKHGKLRSGFWIALGTALVTMGAAVVYLLPS